LRWWEFQYFYLQIIANNVRKKIVIIFMKLTRKYKVIALICSAVIIGTGAIFGIKHFNLKPSPADAFAAVENFSLTEHGFSMQYPAGWSIKSGWARYAPNILDIELNNNKCWLGYTECRADCIDIRIFSGKNSDNNQNANLGSQLYTQMQAIKSSDKKEMVEKIDINGLTVYKVNSNGPTQALNGACSGPLYAFETNDSFVYIFAGFGANFSFAAGEDLVKKLILSITVK